MSTEQSPDQTPRRPHGPEGPSPERLPDDHPFFQAYVYPDNLAGLSARMDHSAAAALDREAADIGNDKTELLMGPDGTMAEILPGGILKETSMDGRVTYDGGTALEAMAKTASEVPPPSIAERTPASAVEGMHPSQRVLWELAQLEQSESPQPPEHPEQ